MTPHAGGAARWIAPWLAAALCWAPLGRAGARADGPDGERATAPFWREVGRPGNRRAFDLMRAALVHERAAARQLPTEWPSLCRRALSPGIGEETLASIRGRARALRELARQAFVRRARLDNALERLARARHMAPDEPEIQYALARALLAWEEPGPLWRCAAKRRDDEAIALLRALRREHPGFAQASVTFDLAVALTRKERFAEAAAVYAEAIALALDPSDAAVLRSNMAEVMMLSGELEAAVGHYQRALRDARGGRDYLLPLWGLAVAFDRMGEHEAALEHAGKAVAAEGGRMSVLRSDGVFFEPSHEIYYYEALGHEALAARDGADAARELRAAAGRLRVFIAAAGEHGAFAAEASASLARIERALAALPARAGQRETTTADALP